MSKKRGFETIQVHAGQRPDSQTGSRALPIYQTTSYVFRDSNHAADLFALKEEGNIYTRIGNPTTSALEERLNALDEGVGALAVSSGSAAVSYAILNIVDPGCEVISATTLYGGTYSLFANTLPEYGINTVFVDPDDPKNFENAINEKTRAIFIESIGNPNVNIIDFEAVSSIAKKHKIPLIVDNTFATPYLFKPLKHGADIVVYSATKFIAGHGTSIGGVIVDGGSFDWSDGKFKKYTVADKGYHGLKYCDLKESAFITRCRVKLLRDMGACISPFNSFLILQGLETLSLRMERHVENVRKVIAYLENHDQVAWVNHPEAKDSRYADLSQKYFPKGASSIFTFGLKGGYESAKRFIDNVEIFSLLANVGDAKSLVIHPASTTHSQLSKDQLEACSIGPDLIRVSVGIETADDLIEDIGQAIEKSI